MVTGPGVPAGGPTPGRPQRTSGRAVISGVRINVETVPAPSSYGPAPGTIPDTPGVYRFRDPEGGVIYVGKAKSLRSRLNSYFADTWSLHARRQQMVTTAGSVDWVTVG